MACDIHFGPALSCKVATAATFLHGVLMSIKCDSHISKLCNLTHTHTKLEAVNSIRISTVRSYPAYKSLILKVVSHPRWITQISIFLRFFASPVVSLWKGHRESAPRGADVKKKINFHFRVREIKKYSLFASANCYEQLSGSESRPERIFIRNLDTQWTLVTSRLQKEQPVRYG